MQALRLRAYTIASAIGIGLAPTLAALRERRGGLAHRNWETSEIDTCIGEVEGVDAVRLRGDLVGFDCRNNRLAQLALEQDGFAPAVQEAAARVGPQRVGLFLGTSTSGIHSSELAYRQRDPVTGALPKTLDYRRTHNVYSVGDFVRSYFGLRGPAWVVSTACSSSAKVFGTAERMIASGQIDAALVGGVDSLCLTTLYGFHSLQLISAQPCRPYDLRRDGLSIGEAAAFALLEPARNVQRGDLLLSGVGESSDAYHMSAPHPEGLGAQQAMRAALAAAGVGAHAIDYIALHGTATPSNDRAESRAVEAVFGAGTPCSSVKGHVGHTLGAAGAVNAVACALALQHDFAPAGVGTQALDPDLPGRYLLENLAQPMRQVMSNALGFGGSNCSLVFSKVGP